MSISGISTTNLVQLGQAGSSYFSQIKEAWQSLQNGLQSGDLAAAKSALTIVEQLQQKYQTLFSSQDQNSTDQFNSDLQALSAAINQGDLVAAKSAFSSLKNDFNTQREQFAQQMSQAAASAHSEALAELFGIANDSSSSTGNSLLDVLNSKGKNLDVVG